MEEKWRAVIGYEGLYEVSNLGNIRSVDKVSRMPCNGERATKVVKGKLLKPYESGNGYFKIALVKDGKSRKHFVHRIVADAFLQNPGNCSVVNHIDFNRRNNKVDNLEWCSQRENLLHGTLRLVEGLDYKDLRIGRFDKDGNLVDVWSSLSKIEETLGICKTDVLACCRGRLKSSYGYIWRYVNSRNEQYLFDGMEEKYQYKKTRELLQIDLDGTVIEKYISAADAQRKTRICSSSILEVAHKKARKSGERKTAGGYIWRFADEGQAWSM